MRTPKKHRTFIIYAKETGEEVCKLQLTNEEYKDLSAIAQVQGKTVSDLLLSAIRDEMEK